jgi:hypothetical protein
MSTEDKLAVVMWVVTQAPGGCCGYNQPVKVESKPLALLDEEIEGYRFVATTIWGSAGAAALYVAENVGPVLVLYEDPPT